MITLLSSDIRGAEYREKAQLALAQADASVLAQVRQKHEGAASTWMALAAFEDRRSAQARKVAAERRLVTATLQKEDADGQGPEEIEPRDPQAQAAQGEGGSPGPLLP